MIMQLALILIILLFNFFLFSNNHFFAKKINLYDLPNSKRKLHKFSIPLNGGVFYFLNILLIFIFDIFFNDFKLVSIFNFTNEINILFTLVIMFSLLLLGIIDDKISLTPISKSAISIIIFLSFFSFGADFKIIALRFETFNYEIDLLGFSLIFSILSFLTLQILLNMYDGINLQSGVYYSFILLNLILVNQNNNFSIFCFLTLIYLVFFLFYNYKEKMFLGDNGVYMFSFILSLLLVVTYNKNYSIFFIEHVFIILFIPFIDMIRLFFKRLLQNNNPLIGDREHLHHILLKKYGIIKSNILLIFPITFSTLTIHLTNLHSVFIIIVNIILYLVLLNFKKNG